MSTNPLKKSALQPARSVIRWLLDSDPSIRWQVLRDLIDAPTHAVAAERARVAYALLPTSINSNKKEQIHGEKIIKR